MQQVLNTLYVTTPEAYLHLDNATLRVEVERETKLRVPLHHLSSVVCFGHVLVSPILMHRLADEGKSLVLLDTNGRFKARLEGAVSGNILLRQAQHRQAGNAAFALAVAKSCIAGKIKNCRQILRRGAREAADSGDAAALTSGADELAHILGRLERAPDLDVVRGLEGDAAKRYFGDLNHLLRADIRPAFTLAGRSRRPPLDRMNALLSFLYSMLMNDVRSAIESVGLDPQLGFLHAVRPGRAALALDLMEEFRPLLADRLALTLVNRHQLRAEDFVERDGGAIRLKDEARRLVITAFQERKKEELAHPLLETSAALGLVPFLQARFLARTIRGEMPIYLPFCPK